MISSKREVEREDSFSDWPGETCYRCGVRVVTGFEVSDEIWNLVVDDPDVVWCQACFDKEAQQRGIEYQYNKTAYMTWSMWEKCDG